MAVVTIDKIYEMIIKHELLTKDNLLKNGYLESDIECLVKSGIINFQNGQYYLVDVSAFYKYGVTLLVNGFFAQANECFKICHQLDPLHRDSCLQLFLHALKHDNIPLALSYFDILLTIDSEENRLDNNLYIHLLNYLEKLPNKYRKQVNSKDFIHIAYQSSDDVEIRKAIGSNRLTLAMALLNSMMAQNPIYNVKLLVLKELLSIAIEYDRKSKRIILDYINQECYYDLVKYLENIRKVRNLDTQEYYILLVSEALVRVIRNKEIPMILIKRPQTIKDAIKGNNFEEAIRINKHFLKKTNKPRKNDPLMILLRKICNIINGLTLNEFLQQDENSLEQEPVSQEGTEIEFFDESGSDKNLADIMILMKSGLPLEVAIEENNLTGEEILILKLMLARDCYDIGFDTLGEKYLREVRMNSNATERVIAMLIDLQSELNGISRIRDKKNAN